MNVITQGQGVTGPENDMQIHYMVLSYEMQLPEPASMADFSCLANSIVSGYLLHYVIIQPGVPWSSREIQSHALSAAQTDAGAIALAESFVAQKKKDMSQYATWLDDKERAADMGGAQ